MLHTGRCGSTVLARMLRQHPMSQIEWDGEIFERQFNGDLTDHRATPPLRLLQERITQSNAHVFGFETKCHPDQHLASDWVGMTIERYVESLRGMKFADFIILRRRNYLRQLVSFYVGRRRGRWHLEAGQAPSPTRVRIDALRCGIGQRPKPILDLFQGLDEAHRRISESIKGAGVLELVYEDDIESDPLIAYRKIADALALGPITPTIPLARINPFSLREMIANYDEVATELVGSPYEWMLEPPEARREP